MSYLKPRLSSTVLFILFFGAVLVHAQEHGVPVTAPKQKPLAMQADEMYYDAVRARMKGDDKEEEKLLLQVVGLKPDAGGAFYDLSRLSFKQNRSDKAVEYIKKAIALDETNVWYKRQYAEILSLGNKFDEAADQFVNVAKLDKYHSDDLLKAAKLYQHVGKYKEALGTLDMLLKDDATNDEALDQKKSLYLKMNDVDGAVKVVQAQIDANPNEGKYYSELAELYDNNKMPEKAAAYYKKIEEQFGDDALVQYRLAEYYKKNNNKQKYEEYSRKVILNKALDVETQIEFLRMYITESMADSMKRKEGIELAEALVKQNTNNAHALAFYGDVLGLTQSTIHLSAEQYKKALQIDPSTYLVWERLLLGYADRSTADSLILYSEKALRVFPNQARLHYLNGIGYTFTRDYAKAVKSLNRAIDMQPEEKTDELADMYVALGDAYNYMKNYPQSDSSYETALKIAPLNAGLLNNYAYYLSVRGARLDDAERMSKKSLELRKNDPTFMDTYGWIMYRQGKYDKALEYIQKAIDTSGQNTDGTVWEHLGDIQFKLGHADKAVESWKKAKEKGTENLDIDKKIKDKKLYES